MGLSTREAAFSRTNSRPDAPVLFRSNFAEPKSSTSAISLRLSIEYDHETYLQLIAGNKAAEKTANQIYLEERARRLHLRSQDPAISGPQSSPSSTDFECVEKQLRRDIAYGREMHVSKSARK